MATYRDAVDGFIKSAACSVLGTLDGATQLITRKVAGDAFSDFSFPAFLNRHLCGQEPPAVPPSPFTGGQCDCVFYNCSGTIELFRKSDGLSQGVEPWAGQIHGPINAITIEDPSSSRPDVASVTLSGLNSICAPTKVYPYSVANALFGLRNLTVSSVARADGLPDNCGSPSPIVPAPAPGFNQRSGDITYTNNEGVDVTVPIVAAFGYASLNVDASVTIPVTIDVGGITLDADFNLNTGDIQFFPTNNIYGDRRRGTKPTDVLPPPGEDTPDYPPTLPPGLLPIGEGESEGESAIVAVLVTVTEFDNELVGTLFQSDNPDISIPNFGYVSFLCRVGTIDSAWSSDIPVKNRRNVIPCPLSWGAIQVKGTPRQGVSWVLTPLYSKKEAPIVFPA